MDIWPSGTDVTVEIPLVDSNGNALNVAAINYVVDDMNDTQVVAPTALAGFVAGTATASITVPAADNTITDPPAASTITNAQIDQFDTRESRTIVLTCKLTNGNTYYVKASYGLEHIDPLIIGMNSFQTLPNAELTAMNIVGLNAWITASDPQKISALVMARTRICQLNFWLLNSNTNWGQDSMNYIPEGQYQSPYVAAGQNNLFIFNGNLGLLTPTQFGNLPIRFRTVLRYAQVAEADFLLSDSDPIKRRQDGLISKSIGDVRESYRRGKPLDLPVSKLALQYLSPFVTFAKGIGRAG